MSMYLIATKISNINQIQSVRLVKIEEQLAIFLKTLSADKEQLLEAIQFQSCYKYLCDAD